MKEKEKRERNLAGLEASIEDLKENYFLTALVRPSSVIKTLTIKISYVTDRLGALCKKANFKRSSGLVAAHLDTVLQARNQRYDILG